MSKRQLAALMTGAAATALIGSAAATAATIRDERATGRLYDAKTYAACDVRQLTAERTARTLQVEAVYRARVQGGSVLVHVNTKGGATSDPEYQVSGDSIMRVGSRSANTGTAAVTKQGATMSITIALSAIGNPRGAIGVQIQTCGEGATDVAPGGHYFDDTRYDGTIAHRYLVATPAERVIEGSVALVCASSGRSCRRLPVEGTRVRAVGGSPRRTYEAITDNRGRFELGVDKGAYSVTAEHEMLRVRTGARRVDVTSRRRGSAAFEACGIKPGARTSAVPGGVWRGGNEDCLNYIEISWRPSSGGLVVSWASAPVCTGVGGNRIGPGKVLVNGWTVDPRMQGTNLVVGADDIGFFLPIQSVHSGNNVNGTVRANGTGSVNARYVEGLCTYAISKLPMKR